MILLVVTFIGGMIAGATLLSFWLSFDAFWYYMRRTP